MFPEHYLEWIHVRDRAEAAANVLRLDLRSDWRRTGACPFGIGLRGPPAEAERGSFRPYQQPGRPPPAAPLLVHVQAWEPSPLPMLFTYEGSDTYRVTDMPPRVWKKHADGEAFAHARRAEGLAAVTIEVPADVPPSLAHPAPHATIRRGERFRLDVTLAAEPFPPLELFGGLVVLRSDRSLGPRPG